tara:strand:- start:134 stop:463 length:330 start_codon:yes stop_codon:yes gene_type:complete
MMGVWDPKDKATVFSQIKKLLSSRTGLLRMSRVCLYPGILLILILFLLIGCATFKWPWEKEMPTMDDNPKEFICTKIDCGEEDIEQRIADEQNTIACIKLQPECKLDEE